MRCKRQPKFLRGATRQTSAGATQESPSAAQAVTAFIASDSASAPSVAICSEAAATSRESTTRMRNCANA
jgi:hypothetical protein